MAQTLLKADGSFLGSSAVSDTLRKLAQQNARVACAGVAATTDSSTGTAGAITLPDAFVAEADDSTSLAQKASSEAAFATIKNACAVAAGKGNLFATILGCSVLVNSTGGTIADADILPAVTKTVTAAAIGIQEDEANLVRVGMNKALYNLVRQANQIAKAIGEPTITMSAPEDDAVIASTLAAIPVAGGTAADPGISKADVDAALTVWANTIASLAEVYNAANTAVVKVRAI